MAESVLHSSPSFRFHHHPNSSNYLTSNENHHAVVVGRTVEFGCMQECQAEKSRRQSLLIQWLQARKEGKRRGGQAKARKKRFRFRFPGCCCCFPSSSNPLFSSVIIVRERECHHKRSARQQEPRAPACPASLPLSSCLLPRHPGSFPSRESRRPADGRRTCVPAAERSSNVCMALVLDCQLVPIPSPFAACVQIDLGLCFGYLLLLVTRRGFFLSSSSSFRSACTWVGFSLPLC